MKYFESNEQFGDRALPNDWKDNRGATIDVFRRDKKALLKGFHQDYQTYLGSITKLIWAQNVDDRY
jgi:hypothetical protein